jgi:glutamine synthetase adenylyltransferase
MQDRRPDGTKSAITSAPARYHKSMTGLLEQALRRVESLSREEQDAIASQIIETLDDDEAWASRLRRNPDVLSQLADEALREHKRGETRPLDELIA